MTNLIVGGSSGLGLGLAARLEGETIVTGRTKPKNTKATFKSFDLTQKNLPQAIEQFVSSLPEINCLVYAAGFYQEGLITDLSEQDIEDMLSVCGRGLIYFVRAVLQKQKKLDELVVITSSTQYKPQRLEPVYSFTKSGEGHFANSLAEDGRVKKVLVFSPSGTKTNFWRDKKHPDYDNFLDEDWVVEQLEKAQRGQYRYKLVKIYRMPAKTEVIEER